MAALAIIAIFIRLKILFTNISFICKLVTYSFLRPFFINQINQVLVAIHFLCLSKMHLGRDSRVFKILVKLDWRAPFHVRFHAPNKRDRTSDLYKGSYFHLAAILNKNVLCLDKICSVAFSIKASRDKSATWPSAIFS